MKKITVLTCFLSLCGSHLAMAFDSFRTDAGQLIRMHVYDGVDIQDENEDIFLIKADQNDIHLHRPSVGLLILGASLWGFSIAGIFLVPLIYEDMKRRKQCKSSRCRSRRRGRSWSNDGTRRGHRSNYIREEPQSNHELYITIDDVTEYLCEQEANLSLDNDQSQTAEHQAILEYIEDTVSRCIQEKQLTQH